jgi:hypothetical protein
MKSFLAVALLVTLTVPAYSGGRRRSAAVSPSRDEITIAFVGLTGGSSEALVDAGTVTQKRVRRPFGIRLDAQGKTGVATLRAFLETYDGRCVIRIDGKTVGTVPVVIDAQAPLNEVTTHILEIEVPASVPEGAFASSVRWEVTTN